MIYVNYHDIKGGTLFINYINSLMVAAINI